jgi:predicted dehydrogenase
MLNVAIVGVGNIGNIHAREYMKRDDCKIVAVCDVIKEKADKAAQDYDANAFYSVQDMLNSDVRIDAASMCTKGEENGGDHYQPTMELLNGGIPVLGEKPISNSIPEAREMVALAKEKGLRYGVDLNHRFTPAAAKAKEWVDEGKLGEIQMVNMTMWINNPSETSPWFHIRALHPHSIDVMRYFCGDVKRVCAFFKRGPNPDSPDGRRVCWSNMQLNMVFADGVVGNLRGSYDATGPGGPYGLETLEVVGVDARFILEEACEHLTFCPRRTHESATYHYLGGMRGFDETFGSRIGRWVEQNLADAPPEEIEGSGEEALKAQLVIEAAVKSWETGTVVEVEDV